MDDRQVFPFEELPIEMMVSDALRTTTKTILDALGVNIPPLSDDALMDIEDAFAEWADESHELAELGIQSVIERNTNDGLSKPPPRFSTPTLGPHAYREHFADLSDPNSPQRWGFTA
jgi:hypothetical protein